MKIVSVFILLPVLSFGQEVDSAYSIDYVRLVDRFDSIELKNRWVPEVNGGLVYKSGTYDKPFTGIGVA